MIRIVRWCAVSLSVLAVGACLVGCQAVKDASFVELVQTLKDGQASGKLSIRMDGSPLGFSVDQHYHFGPSMHVEFDGGIDFTRD